jgi:hypothetical protein
VTPLFFRWEGDGFKPIPRHAKECDRRYTIGEHYALEEVQERSSKSHAQYFAAVTTAWQNLPDHIAEQFPTADKLRKHALIRCGFHDKTSILASSRAEALRLAAFIRAIDDYAIVTVNGSLVERYTAKSQSYRAMPKGEFQASKQAVLDWIASLVGTDAGTLARNAEEVS